MLFFTKSSTCDVHLALKASEEILTFFSESQAKTFNSHSNLAEHENSRDVPDALDVGPRSGRGRVLGEFLQQEVHELEEEGAVAAHDEVADGDNRAFAHGEARARELREKRLLDRRVERDEQACENECAQRVLSRVFDRGSGSV